MDAATELPLGDAVATAQDPRDDARDIVTNAQPGSRLVWNELPYWPS